MQTPIGVFDSGFGGLSVLRSMIELMPERQFIYLSDIAYAPYGERSDEYIIERSRRIAHFMHDVQKTSGLVIACNTATAAAIQTLRSDYGVNWPIIGTEPGIKPAAKQATRIAIMATRSTLQSNRLHALIEQTRKEVSHPLEVFLCPCHGLAKAIDENDEPLIKALVERYCAEVMEQRPEIVVLGCTHYPLVVNLFQAHLPNIPILDTGAAIARRVMEVLPIKENTTALEKPPLKPTLQAWTNDSTDMLKTVVQRWLPHTPTNIHFWQPKN